MIRFTLDVYAHYRVMLWESKLWQNLVQFHVVGSKNLVY